MPLSGEKYTQEFLGAFPKLQNATIRFVMSVRPSVCLSVCPLGTILAPNERILMKLDIWAFLQKPVQQIPVIFVTSYWNLNSLERLLKHPQISNFMKIRPVGAELFHSAGEAKDNTVVAFPNFASASYDQFLCYLTTPKQCRWKHTRRIISAE